MDELAPHPSPASSHRHLWATWHQAVAKDCPRSPTLPRLLAGHSTSRNERKCCLDSAASPQWQRLVSVALMMCRYQFSGVMPVRSCARTLACLLPEAVIHALGVTSRPSNVNPTYRFSKRRRHPQSCSHQALLRIFNRHFGQTDSVLDFSSLVGGVIC